MPHFKTKKQKFHQTTIENFSFLSQKDISTITTHSPKCTEDHPTEWLTRDLNFSLLSSYKDCLMITAIRRKLMAINTECSVRLFLFRLCISKQAEANVQKYFIPFLLIHLFFIILELMFYVNQ